MELVPTLRCLWNIALTQPDDPEFPSLGIFNCMAKLLKRCTRDQKWFSKKNNVYVPYYAAHIIGSYTMNKARFSVLAVKSVVILPLIDLLRGKITWVEQRVAVRALGHIARHRITFEGIEVRELEIIKLAIDIDSKCNSTIYSEFACNKTENRYHHYLMTKGLGGLGVENKKAESWACQMQCWSLYLLNSFVTKKKKNLCGIWGGLQNQNSLSGIGLIRSLCDCEDGRKNIARFDEVIDDICNLSRNRLTNTAAPFLADLVEPRTIKGRRKMGDMITQVLLQNYAKTKYGQEIEEIWDLKLEKIKRDKIISEQEMETELSVSILKREGNKKFWSTETEAAENKYTKALDLCPLKLRKERIVLYSDRAQCYLVLGEAETGETRPHIKSQCRRSQGYGKKGLARLSLMDCFISSRRQIPYYAMRMLNKQMTATWTFEGIAKSVADDIDEDGTHKARVQHGFTGGKRKENVEETILKRHLRSKYSPEQFDSGAAHGNKNHFRN
ncbi:unnamed protein product [Withania somnifera]